MSTKLFVSAVAAAAIVGGVAHAANWGEKIALCTAAADQEGLIEVAKYDAEFDGGTARRLDLVFSPKAGGDDVEVQCKISRGKVKSVKKVS